MNNEEEEEEEKGKEKEKEERAIPEKKSLRGAGTEDVRSHVWEVENLGKEREQMMLFKTTQAREARVGSAYRTNKYLRGQHLRILFPRTLVCCAPMIQGYRHRMVFSCRTGRLVTTANCIASADAHRNS